jgi:hypothetical protein
MLLLLHNDNMLLVLLLLLLLLLPHMPLLLLLRLLLRLRLRLRYRLRSWPRHSTPTSPAHVVIAMAEPATLTDDTGLQSQLEQLKLPELGKSARRRRKELMRMPSRCACLTVAWASLNIFCTPSIWPAHFLCD